MSAVWVLGGTGRCGRAIAANLAARGAELVLVGRNASRLAEAADPLGARTVVAGSVRDSLDAVARERPAVVVNTVGPFTRTAPEVLAACPPGTGYVDLSNELASTTDLLDAHDEFAASDRCAVTGAGFGVLATESVVRALCAGRTPPARVRVDAAAAVDGSGPLGPAVAASAVDVLSAGGLRYAGGKLVRARLGGDAEQLTAPDGTTIRTASGPAGDLAAAQRASAAPSVVAASTMIPAGRVVGALLPVASALLALPAARAAASRLLARSRAAQPDRTTSWAHARAEWDDGQVREGWLRSGEGMAFTANVAAEVAHRLAHGGFQPGSHTPGSLLGPELAEQAGGKFFLS